MASLLAQAARHSNKRVKVLWAFGLFFVVGTLFMWIGFPYLFKAVVEETLTLQQYPDGQLSKTTFLWTKPPVDIVMSYYMFNLTNMDAVTFFGEKPALVQVGPFAIQAPQEKRLFEFSEDQASVWYRNFNRFVFDKDQSCEDCDFLAPLSLPNLPGLGAHQELINPLYNVSEFMQQAFAIGVMLLGERPFIPVKFGELIFDGYNDALLSVAHSDMVYYISKILGQTHFNQSTFIPIPVPPMPKMAFMYGYNNSNDAPFVVDTGKNDINCLGQIIDWANMTSLPANWYTTPTALMINGSDSGSFQHKDIKKDDILRFYMPFFCRSFYMTYDHSEIVHGIPSYEFHVPPAVFDTTLEENRGMRYTNFERVNYAPGWPNCPSNREPCLNAHAVDCGVAANLCHSCCNGTFYDGTYLIPPGIYPVNCYPGTTSAPPFTVFFSPPHFSYSPPEVYDRVYGMEPKLPEHVPMKYSYEPFSGTPTNVHFQFQVSTPIFKNLKFSQVANMPDLLLPFLWVNAQAKLHDSALSTIRFGFVTVPRLALALKIISLILAIVLPLAGFIYNYRRNKQKQLALLRVNENGHHIGNGIDRGTSNGSVKNAV